MPEFEYLQQLTPLLLSLGVVGLFVLALIDSAGLPTGGGPDLVLLVLAVDGATYAVIGQLVAATVLGSALGCLVLYVVGHKVGTRILERIAHDRCSAIEERIHSHGLWAIGVAMVGPPPYPTKVFVLSAGVFSMAISAFLSSVVLGRLLRYGVVGLLAAWLGPLAETAIMTHYPTVFIGLIAVVALILLGRWRRPRSALSSTGDSAAGTVGKPVDGESP